MTKEEFTKNVLEAEKGMYCTAKAFLHNDSDCADAVQSAILTVENKGFIKKFGGDKLISINSEYDDILFSDYAPEDIVCCGLVIRRV